MKNEKTFVILLCNKTLTFLCILSNVYCMMFQKDQLPPFDSHLPADSVFYKLGQHGLISFTDYVFLLVVLSSMSSLLSVVRQRMNVFLL